MQIDYELTQRDFIDSFACHHNRNALGKWLRRVFVTAAITLAAVIAFGLAVKPSVQATKSLAPFFVVTFLWIGALWLLPKWNARRQFLKQPGAQGPRTVVIDNTGARWSWNGGSSNVSWRNYVRALEGKNQFLLYTSPACFNIIPKRALTPDGFA